MDITSNIEQLYKEKKGTAVDPDIFLLCPVTIILGQTRSGKTVLLQNLLTKGGLIKQYGAENIYIFSKTVLFDKTWKPYLNYIKNKQEGKLLEKNIHCNEKALDYFIDYARNDTLQNGNDAPKKLIILDDMICSNTLSMHSSKLSEFAPMARHFGCSIIILVQKYNKIATTIRAQCDQVFCGFCSSNIKQFIDDFSQQVPSKKLVNMYCQCVSNDRSKFNFMVVRRDKDLKNGYYRSLADDWKCLNPYDF